MRRSPAVALLVVAALAGCGGSDHPQVDPEVMLDQASRHPISSAKVDVDARLQVLGVERLSQPLRLRFEGPYASGGGQRIPSFDWRVSASALGFPVAGRLVSTGENVYLSIYGDEYEVGKSNVAAANDHIRRATAGAGALLDLNPRRWFGHPRMVGEDNAGGTDCERIAAPLRRGETTRQLSPLAQELGLPEPLALSGRATACVGYDDRRFHGLDIRAAIGIPAVDRPYLGRATGALLDGGIVISDIGEPRAITAPGGPFKPIRELFLTLNDLAG